MVFLNSHEERISQRRMRNEDFWDRMVTYMFVPAVITMIIIMFLWTSAPKCFSYDLRTPEKVRQNEEALFSASLELAAAIAFLLGSAVIVFLMLGTKCIKTLVLLAIVMACLCVAAVERCSGATGFSESYPSCPRVVHHLGNKTMPCSGVLVWKSERLDLAQVVTAAHLFTEGVGTVRVSCADGKTYLAHVVHIDRPLDFAVLHIRRPLCRVIRFAARLPVAGARLFLGGYPRGGRFRWRGARLIRVARDGSLMTEMWSQPGDSGGPVVNENRELVGLIADTHNPATCPNRPNCADGVVTGGPSVTAIAAATAKYQALAMRTPGVNTRLSVSTNPPDT